MNRRRVVVTGLGVVSSIGVGKEDFWKNLIDCCRTRDGSKLWSPMDLAFRTQTVLHMAMLAMRNKRTATFDAERREISI